jgi:hypothetical protein
MPILWVETPVSITPDLLHALGARMYPVRLERLQLAVWSPRDRASKNKRAFRVVRRYRIPPRDRLVE